MNDNGVCIDLLKAWLKVLEDAVQTSRDRGRGDRNHDDIGSISFRSFAPTRNVDVARSLQL